MKTSIFLQKTLVILLLSLGSISSLDAQRVTLPDSDSGFTDNETAVLQDEGSCIDDSRIALPIFLSNPSDGAMRVTNITVKEYEFGTYTNAHPNYLGVFHSVGPNGGNTVNYWIPPNEEKKYRIFFDEDMGTIMGERNPLIQVKISISYELNSGSVRNRVVREEVIYNRCGMEVTEGDGTPQFRMAEVALGEEISLSPNPTKDNVNVKMEVKEEADVSIDIYDSVGKMVKSVHNGKLEKGTFNKDISTMDLNSGVYYVVVTTGEERKVEKLVKL